MNRFSRCCFCVTTVGLMLASASLGGCAEPQATPFAGGHNRLFYIGLALYSESWSENDVVDLAGELQTTSAYHVLPLIASNVSSVPKHYPTADDSTIAAMVGAAAAQAGPEDVVFVYISTHGARQVLARKVGNNAPIALPSRELARKLAPLAGHRTVILISACYSGSLISDLQAPERIIITAARADRSSFGCASGNRHTFFGEADLNAFGQQRHSLHQIFATIREDVARKEAEQRFRPSEPQVSIGAGMFDFYDAPLF